MSKLTTLITRGKKSRKLAPLLGAPWTYGVSGDKVTAPGQMHILELLEYFKNSQ